MSNRVVITGLGVVSPVGIGKDAFWDAMMTGKNGIDKITRFDATEYKAQVAGEVKDFEPADYMDKKESKRIDRYAQFAVAAAKMAIEDAKLDLEAEDRERIGTYVGSGIGGIETMHGQYEKLFDKGPSRISPFFIPMMIGNMAAGHVSIAFGLKGPSSCVVTACATGTNNIGDAFRVLQRGDADVMLAGGTEASISPAAVAGFCAMKALCSDSNDNPQKASRPFDATRSGFVMGEGAGIVVLETLEHAEKRGAHIYAEVAGYGTNSDAYHITSPAPHGELQAKCMALALKDAGLTPAEVDYVNAHGTSTHLNDLGETEAIKTVWGDEAKNVSVSSIKSMTGHLLGGAGGVEGVVCVKSIEEDFIHQTVGTIVPGEGCDLDYTLGAPVETPVMYAMSNSLGFGGHNATILMKKYVE